MTAELLLEPLSQAGKGSSEKASPCIIVPVPIAQNDENTKVEYCGVVYSASLHF